MRLFFELDYVSRLTMYHDRTVMLILMKILQKFDVSTESIMYKRERGDFMRFMYVHKNFPLTILEISTYAYVYNKIFICAANPNPTFDRNLFIAYHDNLTFLM